MFVSYEHRSVRFKTRCFHPPHVSRQLSVGDPGIGFDYEYDSLMEKQQRSRFANHSFDTRRFFEGERDEKLGEYENAKRCHLV